MQDLQPSIAQFFDLLKGIWIKKRIIIICSWIICPIGFFYVATLPNQYESSAEVYVDTGSPLEPVLTGMTIKSDPREEIRMMAQTLLSRSNLETIARESDLDITTTTDAEFSNLIDELSRDINLIDTGKANIYNIAYENRNPVVAQRVVQETLSLFVEGSLGNNRRDTDTAGRFLDEQIADYESRLGEAEQRLAAFKRKYSEILPMSGSFYSAIGQLREQLDSTQLQIRQARQKIDAMKGQISGAKVADSFGVRNEDSAALQTRYDERIKSLEDQLDTLMLRYTDQHPDVIETKQLLSNLEDARQQEIDQFMSEQSVEDGEPVGAYNSQISLEVSRLQSEIASLQVQEEDLEGKIADLESKIDLIPQIEAEQASLNRDYGITKQRYQELLNRRESADLSRRADVSAEEFQFRIIEPPLVPNQPSGPQRLMLYTLVLLVGFGVGVGIAFLMNQLSPVLVRARQLRDLTDYPVWGTVTHLDFEAIHKDNKRHYLVFAASSLALVVIYGALMAAELMNFNLQGVLS